MIGIGIGIPFYKAASGFDPDASAFITAAGITDQTQKTAINQLVIDLKSAGLWAKMKAIYPIVGGTATTCKFNLMNPADTDAAFRLTFSGGWTFSAQGAKPNGTNAYADTYININSDLSQNNTHVSIYINENITSGDGIDIGNSIASGDFYFSAYYFSAGANSAISNINNTGLKTVTNNDTRGFYVSQRIDSSNRLLYKNGSLIDTFAAASTTPINAQVRLSKLNDGVEHSSRRFASFTAGQGLTNTEISNLYTAIQSFQTILGRQV